MDMEYLRELLNNVKNGSVSVDDALKDLKKLPFEDIGFAKIDHHRNIRNGFPEVIYSEGKTIEQIKEIVKKLIEKNNNIMATRADKKVYEGIKEIVGDAVYYEAARIVVVKRREILKSKKTIAVVSAGTSDIPVAEEAAVTCEVMGNVVERVYDVGVAGIHRLFAKSDVIMKANVLVVVAGMEGALASVVSGLVDRPVIAVPTSVGYGASFRGLSALLTMLNSCATGIGVVNIDNGFGAGYLAALINR
ncbi:nickel pincer cofactor biosynthesis protein LarB [Acetivibrio saccincola]|jgi:NCAIR mutase (PurE)-related protein|uniref:1-(5-phosphoribosyl)-5-amino-4-imidazole-carboxylate carboxylase n=1 Tax=Acetivibrio saccincola TaxID=1677857 RepID=A0A2K9E6X5_9FIRM|nr:nickel pincer cofactor biosynthesis protein LarB [Acetivibrio saccincola]AUG58168.1 AIR carboxylase [Acetivibrio saccincola]NLW26708.1 nickel pincer cofactor biosynthesis protein LarB [Acetivibrio saccincola]PQQ68050.1 1-(5-phosphoribosyl)-5-amino-4-imidazole-carboxylate carboxylase [Acetivibrio saccincola]HOA96994.1 nickel pincer cofactor biosynthesis protein LarB [Acetivibrio saccincola]HQD27696.1 nickel pincer cofactor biosynthesis protein LarB [Acetivibrio saccincola]